MNRFIRNKEEAIHRMKNAFGRDIYDYAHMIYGVNGFNCIKHIQHIHTNDDNKGEVDEYIKYINTKKNDIINYTATDKIFVDGVIIFHR